MRITVKNTGCGFGDMLHRIDHVYRIAGRLGWKFYMPIVSSGLHDFDYGKEFGFEKYFPHRSTWDGRVEEVIHSDLLSLEVQQQISTSHDCLFEIAFQHENASLIFERLGLIEQQPLDYSPFLIAPTPSYGRLDYILHLRLGDNYIYKLSEECFLDSGRRRVVHDPGLLGDLLAEQWTISRVRECVDWLEGKGFKYRIFCDGVESAIRHIRWHTSKDYEPLRSLMLKTVTRFADDFAGSLGGNQFVSFGNQDVVDAVGAVFHADNLVYSTGGFLRGINKFMNKGKTNAILFNDFYNSIRVAG